MEETLAFVVRHGYLVLFLAVFAEQIGLPLPALPILLAGGALARTGALHPLGMLAVCVAAAVASDLAWYEIGRRKGGKVLALLCRISLEPDSCVRNTEEMFSRHGARSLLFAKFMPGWNTAAPPLAGIVGLRLPVFLAYDSAGALLWVLAFTGLGYLFGDQLEAIAAGAVDAGARIGLAIVLGLGLYIAWKWLERHRFLRELRVARITPDELAAKLEAGEDIVVVDLRHSSQFALEPESVPGALHLPVERLESDGDVIPGDREIVLLCT